MRDATTLQDDLADLVSAEDFLDYFAVPYDPHVVQVNRLHILQRFHDYLARAPLPEGDAGQRSAYGHWLAQAYQDFVHSDARTEKVLKVYRRPAPQTVRIPIDQLTRR